MKTALISDVHGNEAALDAVLEDIQSNGVSAIVMLGDISFRGPKPAECLEKIRRHCDYVIKGNADEWAVRGILDGEVPDGALEMMRAEQVFTAGKLSDDQLTYLHNLPSSLELPLNNRRQLFAVHASPESLFTVIPKHAGDDEFTVFNTGNPRADFYAYAHIHDPHYRRIKGKSIINTGSVGLPFDGSPEASYVILDRDDDIHVQFRRVSYDTARAVQDLTDSGYPAEAIPLLRYIYENGARPV
ncbi:metallophosphoesterase family protein [Alkalicoccus luteus]|uniref:Metallophosphoesterase family protein n=1 Tax=Alkalicoccus luteus TaxID=1237094 RepID=A0A969PR45_9BACI|nr:metallophosphoesterase family protein [Alkalicoccus luteus]NJP38885.1 metallophosphoesterase family protein [Alkalicoccus luteus]